MGWRGAVSWSVFYGGSLAVCAFFSAGAGHGTYVPLGISASPVSVIPDVLTATVAIPLFWGAAGGLATSSKQFVQRFAFWIVMLLHYAALPLVLSESDRFGDWDYARRDPGTLGFFLVVYGVGQVGLWILHFRAIYRPVKPRGACQSCGYDRRGVPTNSPCPECGRGLTSTATR
jgi:hypothetical protein